jgi:hypothetical protein
MRRRASELALSLAVALFAAAAGAQTLPGDGIAAIVGSTVPQPGTSIVILRSDVTLRARMLLLGRGGDRTLDDPVPDSLLGVVLRTLIDEALIALEARRIDLPPPSAAALQVERARLHASVGGENRLKLLLSRVGVTPVELAAIVERRARVAAFLELHLGGENLVAEHEVKKRFAEGNHPFVGMSYEDAAAPLRVMMVDERIVQAVAEWVAILRERTPVLIRADYGQPPKGAK